VPGDLQGGEGTDERASAMPPEAPADTLKRIYALLQQRTRHDFSLYKSSTLYRRIERRMAIQERNH